MGYTNRVTEVLVPLGGRHPVDTVAGAIAYTGYVSLANYHRALVVIDAGVFGGTGHIDIQLYQALTTGGGSPKVIAGKALTQTLVGGSYYAIELQTEELDGDGGFDCIAVGYTVTHANCLFGITIWGAEPRFMPVPTTGWQEIIG